MKKELLLRHDVLALGALALLVLLAAVIISVQRSPERQSKERDKGFSLINMRKDAKVQSAVRKPEWRAGSAYSPDSGRLDISLSHKNGDPAEGLHLRAEFSPDGRAPAVTGLWLEDLSGGQYRSGPLGLPRGDWVMSLTALRHSQLLFRLEQSLKVE